ASAIDRCRIVSRRRTYEFPFPNEARGISRMLFDDLLYRTALANGAVALEGEPAIGDHRALTCNGVEIRSKVIAGAWGRWGRFDQQLSRAFIRDRTHRSFGFKRHYRGRHEPGVIELYSFARGYLGVNDVEDGITNICGLVHGDRLRQHRGKWESFVEEIRREEQPLDALYGRFAPAQQSFLSSDPVIFRARSAVEQGVFMVGDASGVIDPLTGNGMAMAIQSALLAAPHIEKALHDRGAAEDAYRRAHAAMFAPRIAWSRSVARLLSHPAALDQALRANAGHRRLPAAPHACRARTDRTYGRSMVCVGHYVHGTDSGGGVSAASLPPAQHGVLSEHASAASCLRAALPADDHRRARYRSASRDRAAETPELKSL